MAAEIKLSSDGIFSVEVLVDELTCSETLLTAGGSSAQLQQSEEYIYFPV